VSDQKQQVGTQSLAVQSGGNTTITQGLSPEDMQKILEALGTQLTTYTAIAREIVDARLANFKEQLIEKFVDAGTANSMAFMDPDFQYALTRAQHAYARSGDEGVRDILIDLIAARSKQTDRSRLSMTLNDGVEKAAVLTKNEFAELSLSYLIRYVNLDAVTLPSFGARLSQFVSPLLPDISTENASYQYIEAQSCGSIGFGFDQVTLIQALRSNYFGLFSTGFERANLERFFAEDRIEQMQTDKLIIPCPFDPTKLQVNAANKGRFDEREDVRVLPKNEQENLWSIFDSTVWNGEAFLENVERVYPEIRKLNSLWDDTPLKNLTLTTIGIALGHANASRIPGFVAALGIWIK
jgi:hypothetical protein